MTSITVTLSAAIGSVAAYLVPVSVISSSTKFLASLASFKAGEQVVPYGPHHTHSFSRSVETDFWMPSTACWMVYISNRNMNRD